ncbi:hypothetical protein B0T20DRAFT_493973 [Sordaria brevicollis]|uniref:Uncharacterized protein n=1 Tax=Sordaria brevicollis TaxID=83679 RepID=A0AAE0NRD8_SORBR|nr:hypothetical protein B0T20DRAFT_493973 [Sordaria brevicollis]
MMSSTSFSASTTGPGPFSYNNETQARAGAGTTTGIGPSLNPGSGPGAGAGYGMHPHLQQRQQQQQQPLSLDTEPIILDSTFPLPSPSTTQPHNFTSFPTNPQNQNQQQLPTGPQNSDDLHLQLQNLQSLLTRALSERDSARLSLATLRNDLYNARQVEKRLRIERDEARAEVSFLKKERLQTKQTEGRLRRERDEARLALATAVRGGKISLKGMGHGTGGLGGMGGKAKGKAQGGMTGIEMLLGGSGPKVGGGKAGAGAGAGVVGKGMGTGTGAGQMQTSGVGVGVTAQFGGGGGEQGHSPPGAGLLGGTTGTAAGMEGIGEFGMAGLQQEFGTDIDQQLEEFLMMHGAGSREASPIQQVPTPPGNAGMGYGYEASHGTGTTGGGQFEMMQS